MRLTLAAIESMRGAVVRPINSGGFVSWGPLMAMPPAAANSVRATLAMLDDAKREIADGVANDQYVFWLGSGIRVGGCRICAMLQNASSSPCRV